MLVLVVVVVVDTFITVYIHPFLPADPDPIRFHTVTTTRRLLWVKPCSKSC
jgi:hypothetical protein